MTKKTRGQLEAEIRLYQDLNCAKGGLAIKYGESKLYLN
jgi:hypothetical protein